VPIDRPLGPARLLLCGVALAIFALTFSFEPFVGGSIWSYLH